MNRLTRGFHRVGLVGAVPLLGLAVLFLMLGLFSAKGSQNMPDALVYSGCTAALAILWYSVCRAVAWIVNGFRETA